MRAVHGCVDCRLSKSNAPPRQNESRDEAGEAGEAGEGAKEPTSKATEGIFVIGRLG